LLTEILFVLGVLGTKNPEYNSKHSMLISLAPYYDAREFGTSMETEKFYLHTGH